MTKFRVTATQLCLKLGQHYRVISLNAPDHTFTGVQWRTEEADASDILIYRYQFNLAGQETWRRRREHWRAGLTIFVLDDEAYGVKKSSPDWLMSSDQFVMTIPQSEQQLLEDYLADQFYPLPPLRAVWAVTGTNGKTSTVYYARQLCCAFDLPVITMGTLGVYVNQEKKGEYALTSPPFLEWRKILYQQASSFTAPPIFILEASSHALAQKRLRGLVFHQCAFTSFSQDHLDYHQTMEAYWRAKLSILDQLSPEGHLWVPQAESELFKQLQQDLTHQHQKQLQQLSVEHLEQFIPETERGFRRSNKEMAIALLLSVVPLSAWRKQVLEDLQEPPGRLTLIPCTLPGRESSWIVVDFAHTPDAIINVASALTEMFPQHGLKILFGCGGNRDPLKRPLMGRAAAQYAKSGLYLTSDNPRFEPPEQIMAQARAGIESMGYSAALLRQDSDRRAMIAQALRELGPQEVLLLAGKGHERTTEINGQFIPHQDEQWVRELMVQGVLT